MDHNLAKDAMDIARDLEDIEEDLDEENTVEAESPMGENCSMAAAAIRTEASQLIDDLLQTRPFNAKDFQKLIQVHVTGYHAKLKSEHPTMTDVYYHQYLRKISGRLYNTRPQPLTFEEVKAVLEECQKWERTFFRIQKLWLNYPKKHSAAQRLKLDQRCTMKRKIQRVDKMRGGTGAEATINWPRSKGHTIIPKYDPNNR